MPEFFSFMLKTFLLIGLFWWLGVNFFRHSNEFFEWLEKRKLKKLADEHKDKIIDVQKLYKEEFGFLETPEYVLKRVQEIKESLSEIYSNTASIQINALEFIFLIDELHTNVLKTDRGVYIISKKNINELLLEQSNDVHYYAKKMREYAYKFLPKEGEPIELQADELMYWVRNGMLKRPMAEDGNRVFKIGATLEEIYLNLKSDFVEPHYNIEVVSHKDFLFLKDQNEKEAQEKKEVIEEVQIKNKLIEGKLVLFDGGHRKMQVDNKVIVYDGTGRSWLEDLNGKKINEAEEDAGGKDLRSSLSKKNLEARETEKNNKKAEEENIQIVVTEDPLNDKLINAIEVPDRQRLNLNFDDQIETSKVQTSKSEETKDLEERDTEQNKSKQILLDKETKNKKEISLNTKEKISHSKEKQEQTNSANQSDKNTYPSIESFIEAIKNSSKIKYEFLKEASLFEFPFGIFKSKNKYYLPVKTMLDSIMSRLTEEGRKSVLSSLGSDHNSVSDQHITSCLKMLHDIHILIFNNGIPRSNTILFNENKKLYQVTVVELNPKELKGLKVTTVFINNRQRYKQPIDMLVRHYSIWSSDKKKINTVSTVDKKNVSSSEKSKPYIPKNNDNNKQNIQK